MSQENDNDDLGELHLEDPGSVIMWFGRHQGMRLDELDDNYRWTIVRMARENPSDNVSTNTHPINREAPLVSIIVAHFHSGGHVQDTA